MPHHERGEFFSDTDCKDFQPENFQNDHVLWAYVCGGVGVGNYMWSKGFCMFAVSKLGGDEYWCVVGS